MRPDDGGLTDDTKTAGLANGVESSGFLMEGLDAAETSGPLAPESRDAARGEDETWDPGDLGGRGLDETASEGQTQCRPGQGPDPIWFQEGDRQEQRLASGVPTTGTMLAVTTPPLPRRFNSRSASERDSGTGGATARGRRTTA